MTSMDEKLRWLEARIASSLRPRNEELKNMFTNDENRLAFHEFTQNEDVRRLFVYIGPGPSKEIVASLQPPQNLKAKSIFFLKTNSGVKLTNDNIGEEVLYIDCTSVPLEHLDLLTREVFLPYLCTNQTLADTSGSNADKLMDILHRLMATVEVTQGQVEGKIVLSLPSVEVLAEAAANANRRASVLHVLETTVIGWIRQIKVVLRHEPITDLYNKFGPEPGPLNEIEMWEAQLSRLRSVNQQLDTPISKDILLNLEQANSQYAHSFSQVRKEINKAVSDTQKVLRFLGSMSTWFTDLHRALEPHSMVKTLKPMMTALTLVWTHSKYYHQLNKFHNLLRLISNEVVHRAQAMVGDDILREPLQSHSKLKDALRVCAAFRGTYLDFKDKADDINAKTIAENEEKHHSQEQGSLFKARLYGPHAYVPRFGLRHGESGASNSSIGEDEVWTDSPWPPRNAPCFVLLNSFMERCNDVLELVETTRHFRLLAGAAEVGGAGTISLDALVKEIHKKYQIAMQEFFSIVDNVLSIDGSQAFEKAFFQFRTVVKTLEKQLAEILRQAFQQCHTIGAQLRLLEVFEGISSRELVQTHLKDKDAVLVESFTIELECVRNMFNQQRRRTPHHYNMPPIVSRLMWTHALMQRIKRPMEKMKQVSPHSLEGDRGWHMREAYDEILKELQEYQQELISNWKDTLATELSGRLKQPLLIAEEYDEELEIRPQAIHVNLDPKLLLLMKEVHYLRQPPFGIKLPEAVKELIRNTGAFQLRVTATRLETIVSKYNTIMKTITDYERPMFERKLNKVDQLFEQGLNYYTWKMKESVDFIESAMALVCLDVHQNLDIVQTNCHEVAEITISWSKGTLDIFKSRDQTNSYSMEELLTMQSGLNEDYECLVLPSGVKIHNLIQKSFEAVEISQASPAWRDYVDYMDAIVLDGLKQSTLTSLKSMLNTLVMSNTARSQNLIPILTVRLELIENRVAFRPPLDQLTSVVSVQELVSQWLHQFLARGKLVNMLSNKGGYQDYIVADEEVQRLLAHVDKLVEDNSEQCKDLYSLFRDFSFLWLQDVNQTFEEFLHGKLPLHLRQEYPAEEQSPLHGGGLAYSAEPDPAERSFLTPKPSTMGQETNVPTLDEFDQEIDIYKDARDNISDMADHQDVGWLRVDLRPIKQVLITYASKWMWTFTQYLSDQVSMMLENLDQFLKRIEPEIEGITGEERDTASFMKMMRLFNEVSAQQAEMDGKFNAMNRTVQLLKKYGQNLSQKTEILFTAAPSRWSNLKTKVSLAKQRLGPRIQEESARITKDLEAFGDRVLQLSCDLENSEVYNRDCGIGMAWEDIDTFVRQLNILENEAQDLIELQELLETSVVNFEILPECRHDLNNLKQMWETTRVIDEQQTLWKKQRWQKMDTKFLKEECNKHLDVVRGLPEDAFTWDVYMGLHESITTIQACLPLIDDLSNPAMRTRHWKQLVRVTGGALTIDNDTLKRMTLGELLGLGLQKHVDDVRGIVQRAVKDMSIEKSLKNYEEVWLSKIFEARDHVTRKTDSLDINNMDNQSEMSHSQDGSFQPGMLNNRSQGRATSRVSNQSSHSRNKRGSVASLPASLLNMGEEQGPLVLLCNTGPIFEELENHQISLQAMQSNSAAGSFLDEVVKWQKRLQTIEAVLTVWLEVQEKWVELEDVYSGPNVRITMAHEASIFAQVNRDFNLLMRATERNPNVLQCCSRKNIMPILEHMNRNLGTCHKSLLKDLERRRQIFPRFYFLSMEDVLHIVCNGYDLHQVNMYISKLFSNIGSLVFEELDESEKCNFQIIGVNSCLGERLDFRQPVVCEGQIETWLTSFIQGLKGALQFQMATAMGVEKPPAKALNHQPSVTMGRKIQQPKGVRSLDKKAKDKTNSRASSRQGVSRQGTRPELPQRSVTMVPEPTPDPVIDQSPRSWTLDHVSEVVYLATRVQLTDLIQEAVTGLEAGDRDAMQVPLERINSSIKATTLLLKGREDEKEVQARKQKDQETEGDLDEREPGSLVVGRQGSFRGSGVDLANEGTHTPIPEEKDQQTTEQEGSAQTDTMTLTPTVYQAAPTPTVYQPATTPKKDECGEEGRGRSQLKLVLLPGQIQKLSSLLALLAHLRDLVNRILSSPQTQKPSESFHWKSQLLYTFNQENRNVQVKCFDAEFDYGWEYQGSSPREVITPETERVFVSMTQAITDRMGTLCVGPVESDRFELIHELSRCLGHPLYSFNCGSNMDHHMLQDIFRGLASTGSWVCFNNLNTLDASVLSVFAQLMSTVMEALREGKTSVRLYSEDIQLNSKGACFSLLDSAIPLHSYNPDEQLLFTSTMSQLPDNLLSQFRTVSVIQPDLQLTVEVLLLSQGFENSQDLAHKTIQLYNMCKNLLGTNTFIRDTASLGSKNVCQGWSLQTLKYMVSEAGSQLELLSSEQQTPCDVYAKLAVLDQTLDEDEDGEIKQPAPPSKSRLEENAIVGALRNTYMPRLQNRDASIFASLIADLWPDTDVPLEVVGQKDGKEMETLASLKAKYSIKSPKSSVSQSSLKDMVNLNTPVVRLSSCLTGPLGGVSNIQTGSRDTLADMTDAIAVATSELSLLPGVSFQARVLQLSQMSTSHQTVFVIGPAGCGKSECIKTCAVAEKERGKTIDIQSIFTKALESEELLGYADPNTKEWKDGLMTSILRKFSTQPNSESGESKPVVKILQLDGDVDPSQMEILQSVFNCNGMIVMANNERISLSENTRFIWEMESLSHVSPSVLCNVGVLLMSDTDVGWKLMLMQWLHRRPEADKDLIMGLCDMYVPATLAYLDQCTAPPMFGSSQSTGLPQYRRVIPHSNENMISTFCTILETLVAPYPDLSDVEFERYFNLACIWSFGGTLAVEDRESFSQWWREQFDQYVDYPEDGTVFDYVVDNESHMFVIWVDLLPSYTATPHVGIPPEAFVHTVSNEQIAQLLGLLSDVGKPVLLVGENGCGKTSIVKDRIRTVCSGEVAEVLALNIPANTFTNAKLLYQRLDERLEWKHGKTFVPKGNKRLMCLVDDLNLAQVDKYGFQTASEMIRQHLDDGGFYNPVTHNWRYVKNVTYVSTVNPNTTASVPKLSKRLLRHFAIFGVPYPFGHELQSVFSTLLHTHFITPELPGGSNISANSGNYMGLHDEKVHNIMRVVEAALKMVVQVVVKVTVELQERLRGMFLPTSQRCHYIFTMSDLSTIFKNICLSLNKGCSISKLLSLWQHECHWVYGRRMVNEVDYRRFRQAFITAVKKEFTKEDQVQMLTQPRQPLFSNLIEQDSGVVTAGKVQSRLSDNRGEDVDPTDLYKPSPAWEDVMTLMERGVEEYNKVHPRIKLALYKSVVEEVCRLSRMIASPHEVAHMVLVSEGCPGRCSTIVQLSAHLCGFSVVRINPSSMANAMEYKIDQFKADLVSGYTRAGVKGDRVLLLIHEEELLDEDFLVYLIEFIISGNISYLFSHEDQTTIINSIRTEVTQAGLTYTREVAWDFFLRTVQQNFRICLIVGSGGARFQRRCREYPSFSKNINFIWLPHWSKIQLVDHALYHLKNVDWLNSIERENIAHMLASMHIVLRQQDGQERNSGEYGHITNASYEKFVERYICLANTRYNEVSEVQTAVTISLEGTSRENDIATKLRKQLEHEMVVLEERKAGTIKILSQIGQDTAITEQQVKVVKAQMDKIARLKKLLPEYQVAHERAVYKAIAIVADTKRVVQNIDVDMLAELRSMQKPTIESEDLMAAIIMLLKSPSADLTWQKGAKRQMANLERFIEELMSFDDEQLPESTLNLVEPYLKKPSFDPQTLERKTSNAACGSLCKWVIGVVKYHRMMISKVKPLHQKVDETTQAVDDAEHKMATLENKRKALEVRLCDLARGFEEATIDKNDQEDKTLKMSKMLETAAQLRRILKGERMRSQQIYDSYKRRLIAIPGGCVMASAFLTYLGPYHHNFRRMMLTVHWPNCLRERGIPLVIDSIDGLKGRVIDWAISGLRTASGASSVYGMDYPALSPEEPERPDSTASEQQDIQQEMEAASIVPSDKTGEAVDSKPEGEITETGIQDDQQEEHTDTGEERVGHIEDMVQQALEGGMTEIEEEGTEDGTVSQAPTDTSLPVITTLQYNLYVRSLIKLLMGEKVLDTWITRDFGLRQMENAAMLCSSWQRPAMLLDPNEDGVRWLTQLNHFISQTKLVILDMENRTDPHILLTLEKAILRGKHVLLRNCSEHIDNVISPLIHHSCTAEEQQEDEPRMIRFCERRVLCHPNFRLFMSTTLAKPKFSPEIASTTALVNYGVSHDTLIEDLLTRSFALIRPELYAERKVALTNNQIQRSTLFHIAEMTKNKVLSLDQSKSISKGGLELQLITDIRNTKVDIATRLSETKLILQELEILRDELFPLARRAAVLYAVLRSMACIHREYQFTLSYFMSLFDEAIGGDLPEGFTEFVANSQSTELIEEESVTDTDENTRPFSAFSSPKLPNKDGGGTDRASYEDDFENSSSIKQDKTDAPETTDESASTEAAQRLLATSESLELMKVDIPDMAHLPSEGIEYSSMSANQIKQYSDKLTALVFQRVRQCLYEEDSLLFATMMCLNMQAEAGQSFTEEEMSLLLQGNPGLGMQLSLLDFDCGVDPPSWLHQEKWEDMLAISVLPGPLDSLCAKMAISSEAWEAWYKSPYPETEPVPMSPSTQDHPPASEADRDESGSPDLGNLTDFHQLLIIRMLRPDRLPAAMLKYVNKHLHLNLTEGHVFRINDLLTDSARHLGVLLLLPPSPKHPHFHPTSRLNLTTSPVQLLQTLAKQSEVSVECMKIGEGCEALVGDAIETAEKEDRWLIIENLQLASNQFFTELKYHLTRVAKTRDALPEEKKKSLKFCVFVTTEPCDRIPLFLLQNLHQLAWDKLSVGSEPPVPSSELLDTNLCSYTCPKSCLHTAIVSTLKLVGSDMWNKVRDSSQTVRGAVFGMAVIQGVLVSRQLFGAAGLTQWYPLGSVQVTQAINLILKGNQDGPVDNLIDILSQIVYGNVMLSETDQFYVNALVRHVISQLRTNSSGKLSLGNTIIPTPPANVDPTDYAVWYEEQTANNKWSSLQALGIHSSVEKETNEASSTEFVQHLDHMFETQNLEAGDMVTVQQTSTVNIKRLRSSLDICVEKLPPLLELGPVPGLVSEDYDFPYHRPSVLSVASVSSTLMPESIGYVLLQECLWFNSVMCHIRQQIDDMQEIILGGPEAYPPSLLPVVFSLQEEQLPISWLHPNSQPSTHSLLSWLADLRKRYEQLYRWVKQGMVPTFKSESENPLISRGSLSQVWLGGLVNPQALFTAVRQEKAYVEKCSVEQVQFSCEVAETTDLDGVSQLHEGGLFVEDLHLLGASWDSQRNCLEGASSSVFTIKQLYIWPVIHGESQNESQGEMGSYYLCPVYINKSRQVEVISLPLSCPDEPNRWTLSSTSIVLDLGLPEDGCKKSRSYLMLQKLPANGGMDSVPGTARTSDFGEEDTYGFGNYKEGTESKASVTQLSEQSQLSYKPMTPKALPLPSGLGLTREQPLIEETHLHKENTDFSQKAESSQYGSSQASLKKSVPKSPSIKEDSHSVRSNTQTSEKAGSQMSSSRENKNQNRMELARETPVNSDREQTKSPGNDFDPSKTPSPKPPSEPRRTSRGSYRANQQERRTSQTSPTDKKPNTNQVSKTPESPNRIEEAITYSHEPKPLSSKIEDDNVSVASDLSGKHDSYEISKHNKTDEIEQNKTKNAQSDQDRPEKQTKNALYDSDDDLFGDLPSYQPTLD